ncbi:CaiB/BaiF CoA transferase family protein [Brevundimonas pishanensis]|uniref:CaiB/BaiF CoA transferase family protein n=1 Tax=Brevundimonas pishanensis TaxID=2896315 RepID=UPI001FA791B4|nr:CoA transferase [Brevundimonas pishanensis]
MTEAVRQGPLAGLKVIEFTHMVMGPAAGVILADLGADVIKVEPANGDATRDLKGSGAGYFVMYNRNKRSIRLDMKSEDGLATAKALCAGADVIIENFRAGALDRLGLSYEELSKINPGLIYCSEKGFLPGPYEQRTALDEVAQMMGGLAYMTGPAGRPLRAGASVIDVTGGMFGVIGILAALEERRRTGRGQLVKSALYETTAFLVGQHMAQKAVTGTAARPMPERISAWSIYDVFQTKDGEGVFIGVVTDKLWLVFCDLFGLSDLKANEAYALNNARVAARDQILPVVREVVGQYTREELIDMLSPSGLPFAPIARPEDLFDDPHLNTGGLIDVTMPNDEVVRLPSLPIEMDGRRFNEPAAAPKSGEHQEQVLAELAKG